MGIAQSARPVGRENTYLAVTEGEHTKAIKRVVGTVTYECRSQRLDAATSAALWQIKRITTDGPNTYTDFASNDDAFDKIADNYLSYTYSSISPSNYASIRFDSVNDFVTFGTVPMSLIHTSVFSISFWVKFSTLSGLQYIMSKSAAAGGLGWSISKLDVNNRIYVSLQTVASSNALTFSTTNPVTSGWNHVVVTSNGTGKIAGSKIYLNGVVEVMLNKVDTWTSAPSYTTQELYLANRFGGATSLFGGLMDRILFSNVVFTQAEVTELYAAGLALPGPSFSNYANVQNSLAMGEGDTFPYVSDAKLAITGTMTNQVALDIVPSYPGSAL